MAGRGRTITFYADTPWARVDDPRIPGWAWVRLFRDDARRVRVGTVVIDQNRGSVGNPGAGLPITLEVMRALDIQDLERAANRVAGRLYGLEADVAWIDPGSCDPIAILRHSLREPGEDLGVTVRVHGIGRKSASRDALSTKPSRMYRLTSGPPPGRIPDEYLQRVVKAYHSAAEHGLNPAPTIAADVGANVNTVRSWFKKARARGLMEPGHRGRVG